jgi:hypothetical protein
MPSAQLARSHRGLEARQLVSGWPELRHARQGDLIGFLLIGRAGGRPHLALIFPAGIGAFAERILRLDLVRKREEALRHREGLVDLLLRNAVIDDLEEADVGRCLPELVGDFGLARFEVAQVYARDVADLGRAEATQSPFLLELGETWVSVVVGRHDLERLFFAD